MDIQFFTNSWLFSYDDLTKKELLKRLNDQNPNGGTKQELKLLIFEKEYNQYLVKNYDYSSIVDMNEFGKVRCNNVRKQPYIFDYDLSYLVKKLDKSLIDNIDEVLWVNKERSLLKLRNGKYLITQPKEFRESEFPLENHFSDNFIDLVNNKMSLLSYYLYRKETDWVIRFDVKRNFTVRKQYYYIIDDLAFLNLKIPESIDIRDDLLNGEFGKFDYLEEIDVVYWSDIDFKSGKKNYLFYRTKSDVYILIKFSSRVENETIVIKWMKVYLSKTHKDILDKCLTYEEYKIYDSKMF